MNPDKIGLKAQQAIDSIKVDVEVAMVNMDNGMRATEKCMKHIRKGYNKFKETGDEKDFRNAIAEYSSYCFQGINHITSIGFAMCAYIEGRDTLKKVREELRNPN